MEQATRRQTWQGMNWCRQSTRAKIYDRDGRSCMYCGATDRRLTLDHIIPWSKGGSNLSYNLLTACNSCNSSRGDRLLVEWLTGPVGFISFTLGLYDAHAARPLPRGKVTFDDISITTGPLTG